MEPLRSRFVHFSVSPPWSRGSDSESPTVDWGPADRDDYQPSKLIMPVRSRSAALWLCRHSDRRISPRTSPRVGSCPGFGSYVDLPPIQLPAEV